MRAARSVVIVLLLIGAAQWGAPAHAEAPPPHARTGGTFAVSFPATRSGTALDGRIILLLSRDFDREPRYARRRPDEPL